jgi:hypothetical protein
VKRYGAAIVCAAPLLFGSSGLSAAPDEREQEARVHFDRGLKRLDAREYERALEEFRAAWELWQNPKILLNVGTVLRELGREAAAANAYARYVHDPSGDPARVGEINRLLADLDRRLGRLEIHKTDEVTRVLIDRQPMAPWEDAAAVRVAPGSHQITGERRGGPPIVANVRVAAQESVTVELRADSAADVPQPPPAKIEPRDETSRAPSATSRASHAGQFGAFVRGDIDGKGRGVVIAPGVSFGAGDWFEIAAASLIGRDKGAWLGTHVFLSRTELKPALLFGVPVFFVDGARPGVQGGAGLTWDVSAAVALSVDAGVAHFFAPPAGYDATVFVPSIGLQVRR